ncbi:MAG: acetolactate synthase small subunit [Lachnospiraceae bacterium]|jgi:acetolactate synthase-1/3 small subunit|nr:acetolactate synthase small subunit [Lachnospiraceae bacterium]
MNGNNNTMKKRWISLFVENQVGVLSKISGLFSAKSYNLDSLTVGTTEDKTVSRMTIETVTDDETFEQIKKQLNRLVEVIKVIDFTDIYVHMREILYVKVRRCSAQDKASLFQIAETFKARVIDYGHDSLLLEFVQTATKNDAVVKLLKEEFGNIEVVRGGSVGIESISLMER